MQKREFKDHLGGNAAQTVSGAHLGLQEKARASAKALARTNLPADSDANSESYLTSMRAGYDSLLAREMKKLPANSEYVADVESKASEQKAERWKEKVDEARNNLRTATLELDEMPTDDGSHISKSIIWVAIVLIALCESFLTYKSVGLLDVGNNIVLGLILISFTVFYIAVPKLLRWLFHEYAVDKPYKWIIYIIPVAILIGGYYTIGLLRTNFIQTQAAMSLDSDGTVGQPFILSPWIFLSLNLVFLMVSYYLCSILPSRGQEKTKIDLAKKHKQIEKLEAEVEKYEGYLSQVPDIAKNTMIRASNGTNSRKELYTQVNSLFLETCGAFMDTNVQYRSDGRRPKCFDVPIKPLEDKYTNE